MQLGVDGVFVGSGIFKSGAPEKRARAMVMATTHWNDPAVLAAASEDLGEAMVSFSLPQTPHHFLPNSSQVGIEIDKIEKWANRESKPGLHENH